jgi:hypothetical protein
MAIQANIENGYEVPPLPPKIRMRIRTRFRMRFGLPPLWSHVQRVRVADAMRPRCVRVADAMRPRI